MVPCHPILFTRYENTTLLLDFKPIFTLQFLAYLPEVYFEISCEYGVLYELNCSAVHVGIYARENLSSLSAEQHYALVKVVVLHYRSAVQSG